MGVIRWVLYLWAALLVLLAALAASSYYASSIQASRKLSAVAVDKSRSAIGSLDEAMKKSGW